MSGQQNILQRIPDQPDTLAGPSTPWLAIGALLAGVGTVLLGPILPVVSIHWHLTDSQSGWLISSKFLGSFLGGMTVPRKLRFGILLGTLLACIGFGLFGIAGSFSIGVITLFLAGFGLGQLIASTNILAGGRWPEHTGSALASLNFFWSLGAVGAGVLVGVLLSPLGLPGLLFAVASAFLVTSLGGYVQRYRGAPSTGTSNTQRTILPLSTVLCFGVLLFLYGGLETCLSQWLTTFTIRYSPNSHLLGGQSGTVLLWIGLTAGRALSSLALRHLRESVVQRFALAVSFIFIAAFASAQSATAQSAWCILLGLSLAPFFPATFGIFLRMSPTPQEAGTVLAVSGLGAAAFPKIMGVISDHSSLRAAMAVPMGLALLLLFVSLVRLKPPAAASASASA